MNNKAKLPKYKKKIIFISGLLFFLLITLSFSSTKPRQFPSYCAFCDPEVLDRQTIYEEDLVLALYTYKPILPGHCLVIPKRHVERFEELTDAEILQMGQVLKKVNLAVTKVFDTSSYLLLQKNGLEVGQTVPHVHFHYIPKKAGDNSDLKFLFKMYLANILGPISAEELHETVEKLQQAFVD